MKANTEPGQYLRLFSRVYTQRSWYFWYWSTHRTRHCLLCNHWWCSGYTVMSMCIFKCFYTHRQGIFLWVHSEELSIVPRWCGIVRKAQVWVFFHLSWDISHLFFPAGTGHKKRDEIQLKWQRFTKIWGHYKWCRLSKPTFISIHKDILQTSACKFHIVTPSFLQYFC